MLDKLAADNKYATDVLKVDSTPTFFINGEKIKGETSFEEFQKQSIRCCRVDRAPRETCGNRHFASNRFDSAFKPLMKS